MRPFVTRTDFGLDAQVRNCRHRDASIEFVVMPMVHAASEAFYDAVKRELDDCDIVLYEGVRSTKGRVLIRAYEIAAKGPKLNLVLQRADVKVEFVHADVSSADFDEAWSEIPLHTRILMQLLRRSQVWWRTPFSTVSAWRECSFRRT